MATIVAEHIGRLFISLQQIRQVPRMLTEAAPSMPSTVGYIDVPAYIRERHISSGYRQVHQNWRYYFLSLFQRHNETLNVWTHLVAFLILLAKFCDLAQTVDFLGEKHAWPLLILIISSLSYTGFSVIAHLFGSKSEMCHFAFYYLDYVGVAQYQFGSAVAHFYYAVDQNMHSLVKGIFMPAASILSCMSFVGCSYGKYHNSQTWLRKLGHVAPSALAYAWDISPVVKRLLSWMDNSDDPALVFHFGQVAFFLSSAVFFTFPISEKCFPGRCNFFGQSHQIFHILLSCTTFCQIHASYLDYAGRRELYLGLHNGREAGLFVQLYVVTLVACVLIGSILLRKLSHVLDSKHKCE